MGVNLFAMMNFINFLTDPLVPMNDKLMRVGIFLAILFLAVGIVIIIKNMTSKESFIGTSMWHGYNFQDANKTSKEERTKSLINISKGYLPGERPKTGGLLENFENVNDYYNPRNYEVDSDYHRTVQEFGVDPNPIESLETPEFMVPRTYRSKDKYENLTEVNDNSADAIRLRQIESSFKNVEKNKYYNDLLKSKCRAGNRSSYKNCGCKAPKHGEY